MHNFINNFLPIFEYLGFWGYWIVFGVSFIESIAFFGAIVPGSTIIVFSGILASQGYFNIYILIVFSMIGSILGDCFSYYLGTKGTKFFKHENKFLRLTHLEQGQEFFARHGRKSIPLGRFIGATRAVIPFVAGLTRMNPKIFFKWTVISAFLWAPIYTLLGYFFGSALQLAGIEKWLVRSSVLIFVVCLFLFLIWSMIKRNKKENQLIK